MSNVAGATARISRLGSALAVSAFAFTLATTPAHAVAVQDAAKTTSVTSANVQARAAAKACSAKNTKAFKPSSITISKVATKAKVIPLRRGAGDIPGIIPVSKGKNVVAWDGPGIQPGSGRGHVLMNVHSGWVDRSALGDRMIRSVRKGSVMKVYGAGGRVQCYKVYSVETKPNTAGFAKKYFGTLKSTPKLAVMTCSGRRWVSGGHSHYSHRTVFWAKPMK